MIHGIFIQTAVCFIKTVDEGLFWVMFLPLHTRLILAPKANPRLDCKALTFLVKDCLLYVVSVSEISLKAALCFKKMGVIQHPTGMLSTVKPFGLLLFILGRWHCSLNFCVCSWRGVVVGCIFCSRIWSSLLYPSVFWGAGGGSSRLFIKQPHLTAPTNNEGSETPGGKREPLQG